MLGQKKSQAIIKTHAQKEEKKKKKSRKTTRTENKLKLVLQVNTPIN